MICPGCKKESNGEKWCKNCGLQLETEVAIDVGASSAKTTYDFGIVPEDNHSTRSSDDGIHPGLKVALAVLIPIIVIAVVFSLLYFTGVIKFGDSKPKKDEPSVVLENEDTAKLLKTGMNHLEIGDYEEAETVFKVIMESDPENEETVILCRILHNYNRAVKRIENKDYEDARTYFEKIPLEYTDYAIADDVEGLDSEIKHFERTYEIFEKVRDLMSSGDFENAEKTIELIDKSCLKTADAELLERYCDEIDEFVREKEESEKEVISLGVTEAEEIIRRFCIKYVEAVNNGDFEHVSQYIKGNLYNTQKNMVDSLYSQGITEDFDFLTVKSVQKIKDNMWKVKVSEGETIYYPDGEVSKKTYAWTYTVEFIEPNFYLTNIE